MKDKNGVGENGNKKNKIIEKENIIVIVIQKFQHFKSNIGKNRDYQVEEIIRQII